MGIPTAAACRFVLVEAVGRRCLGSTPTICGWVGFADTGHGRIALAPTVDGWLLEDAFLNNGRFGRFFLPALHDVQADFGNGDFVLLVANDRVELANRDVVGLLERQGAGLGHAIAGRGCGREDFDRDRREAHIPVAAGVEDFDGDLRRTHIAGACAEDFDGDEREARIRGHTAYVSFSIPNSAALMSVSTQSEESDGFCAHTCRRFKYPVPGVRLEP